MGFKKGQNFNHPVKGAEIKVDPIRRKKDIELIKFNLKDKPRDLCLFTLGINTAFRANELLSLTVEQVKGLKPDDVLGLRESKTGKHRQVTLNPTAYEAIQGVLASLPTGNEQFLFFGRRGDRLGVPEVSRKVKP